MIALALVGASVATSALAQSEDPVTLYGRIFVIGSRVEIEGSGKPAVNRVDDVSSLFGVRVVEKLGGGLQAWGQLETAFGIPEGGTTFAGRNSGVGLTHAKYGTIMLGRWDMPFKTSQVAPVDPFADNGLPDITSSTIRQGNFSHRSQNVVQYWSPTIGGFAGRLAYVANEGKTATVDPYELGASLSYRSGPLYIAYAFERHHDRTNTTSTPGVSEDGNGLAASYWVGPVKLMGQVGRYTRTNTVTQKSWSGALEWELGRKQPPRAGATGGSATPAYLGTSIVAIYQRATDGGLTTLATQPVCTTLGLGLKYKFTRRTYMIAQYAKVTNNATARCSFGGAYDGDGPLAGEDPLGYGLTIQHVF
jgi:predicted porin